MATKGGCTGFMFLGPSPTWPLDTLVISKLDRFLKQYVGKGKAADFTSPRTNSGQASWPYETVPNRTISSPSEGGRKPRGENHQALAVKGERHPTCGLDSESNPGCSGERRTCYHGATKPHYI